MGTTVYNHRLLDNVVNNRIPLGDHNDNNNYHAATTTAAALGSKGYYNNGRHCPALEKRSSHLRHGRGHGHSHNHRPLHSSSSSPSSSCDERWSRRQRHRHNNTNNNVTDSRTSRGGAWYDSNNRNDDDCCRHFQHSNGAMNDESPESGVHGQSVSSYRHQDGHHYLCRDGCYCRCPEGGQCYCKDAASVVDSSAAALVSEQSQVAKDHSPGWQNHQHIDHHQHHQHQHQHQHHNCHHNRHSNYNYHNKTGQTKLTTGRCRSSSRKRYSSSSNSSGSRGGTTATSDFGRSNEKIASVTNNTTGGGFLSLSKDNDNKFQSNRNSNASSVANCRCCCRCSCCSSSISSKTADVCVLNSSSASSSSCCHNGSVPAIQPSITTTDTSRYFIPIYNPSNNYKSSASLASAKGRSSPDDSTYVTSSPSSSLSSSRLSSSPSSSSIVSSSSSSSLSSFSSSSSLSPTPLKKPATRRLDGESATTAGSNTTTITTTRPTYGNAYLQYYQRRIARTRKFRLNLFMYTGLYRKQQNVESNYEIFHNPLEDPDATYTSFANPNYFFNRPNQLSTTTNNNNNHHNNSRSADSLTADNNGVSVEKLSLASPGDPRGHYSDYSSCEPTPTTPDRSLILHKLNSPSDDDLDLERDEVYDDVDDYDDDDNDDEGRAETEEEEGEEGGEGGGAKKLLDGDVQKAPRKKKKKERGDAHVFYGIGGSMPWKKSKGILGYLEMLEKQALNRDVTGEHAGRRLVTNTDRDGGDDNNNDDGGSDGNGGGGKVGGPKAGSDGEDPNDNPTIEKFEHATEINSPDSNDSGIQTGEKILSPETPGDSVPSTLDNTPPKEEKEALPEGWQKHEDEDGPYFWHVKSGTIQRDPPPPAPPDGPQLCSPRSISMASDSASTSSNSIPSTPTSVSSMTERHLAEFEGHALQYAAKSLQSMSQGDKKTTEKHSDKAVRYAVRSLGWVRIDEEDLCPDRSSKAVNKCIVDLSLGRNDLNDTVGRWGDGKDLFMDLDNHSLRLVNPLDGVVLNSQPIHSIRVWGVGRDNGRDFAYVARDRGTRMHMCHVFHCETPARQIANTLRDICKKIMLERNLHQSAVARLARPTDLPNLDKVGQSNGEKMSFQNLYNNARFPTPMEEPRKVIRCHYLGQHEVIRPTGRDILNEAIQYLYYRVPPEKWKFVNVAIAPSTITITEHGNLDGIIEECRVRFLSFMGIAADNVKLCAFIMHTSQNKFVCHAFHCEPSAGPMCKTIEAACKLRYQKCLDAHPQTPKNGLQGKSVSEVISSGIKASMEGFKEVKTSAVSGVIGVINLFKGKNSTDKS